MLMCKLVPDHFVRGPSRTAMEALAEPVAREIPRRTLILERALGEFDVFGVVEASFFSFTAERIADRCR